MLVGLRVCLSVFSACFIYVCDVCVCSGEFSCDFVSFSVFSCVSMSL